MSSPVVSVIIPVYGVEKYLDKCIESVLSQTYKNLEIILVDDCSPDGCPGICDSYRERDSRIKVIHKPKNEGLGAARNTGLSEACGEFILFADSDDTLENTLVEKALGAFDENTELAVFGINRVFENEKGEVIKTEKLTPEKMSSLSHRKTADIFAMLNKARAFPFAWNKLYRRSFIDQCHARFEDTRLIEDFLFNIHLFSNATFISVIPDNLYNYRKPAHETLVNSYAPEFFELCKRKYTLEKEYLEGADALTEENQQLICLSYVKHLVSVFLKNRSEKAGLSAKQQRQKIREALGDNLTEEVLAQYRPKGLVMKAVTFLFRKKAAFLTQLMVKFGAAYL